MNGKKLFLFAIALVLFRSPLFAGTGFTYAFGISNSYYASVPHFEDDLPFRSSYAGGVLASPLGFRSDNISVSLDLSARHVSDSILFGSYIARGFWDFGAAIRFSRELGQRFGIFLGGGTSFAIYDKIEEGFVSFSVFAGPSVVLKNVGSTKVALTFPVSVHLRKEITGVTAGVGLRIGLTPSERRAR
jgi:hypothetical protein